MRKLRIERKLTIWGIAGLSAGLLLAIGGLLIAGWPPQAAAQSQAVSLTIYNQNLGLVREMRSITLSEGVNEVELSDVAVQIDPTSVVVRPLTGTAGLSVLEQSYNYDLLDSSQLLSRYIGEEIRLVTQDGQVFTSTLLSAGDSLVLQDASGGITWLRADSVRELRFAGLPKGLITRPTLTWTVDSQDAGEQEVEVSYLTAGLNWNADYILQLDNDRESFDLQSWVTLDNHSGVGYKDAIVKLVAGDIHRASSGAPRDSSALMMAPAPAAEESSGVNLSSEALSEYHLYQIPRLVTLQNNQIKQIDFISAAGVKAQPRYVFEPAPYAFYGGTQLNLEPSFGLGAEAKVRSTLEFTNSKEAGLGLALPAGRVRVYQSDADGTLQLIGEDAIGHTSKDAPMQLELGYAFDLVGNRTQTDFVQIGKESVQESFSITLRNAKEEDVVVRVIEHLYRWSDWEITEESIEHTPRDAQSVQWDISVPKGETTTLTYTALYRKKAS